MLKNALMVSLLAACATTSPTATNSTAGTLGQIQQAVSVAQAVQSGSLTDLLMQRVGVSQVQAQGGAGAILQLAKSKMQASAFSQLEQAVPGIGSLLGAAPSLQNNSTLGGLASDSGLGGNSGNTLLALTSAFQQQGMSPSMISQFIPVIVEYVQGTGGTGIASSLSSVLMGQ